MKSIRIVLFVLLIRATIGVAKNDDKVDFIIEFATQGESPVILSVMTCWDDEIKFQLAKSYEGSTFFPKSYKINKKIFAVNPQQHLLIIDFSCADIKKTMKKIDLKLFGYPFHWLIFNDKKRKDVLKTINPLLDSNVVLAETTKKGFEFSHIYKIDASNELIYQKYGTWSRSDGLMDERQSKILSRTRKDFRGRTITTSNVVLHNSTYQHLTDYAEKTKDIITKVNYMTIRDFLPIFNATHRPLFYDTWGYLDNETKKYTALFGDILYRRADLTGTPIFMLEERIGIISYLKLNTRTIGRIVFRAPQMSSVANLYTLPFNKYVWFSALLLAVLSAVFIFITMILEKNDAKKKVSSASEKSDMKIRFTDSALTIVAAICQMGQLVNPKFQSSKIIMFFIFLSLSFLYTCYTANIVSLLQSPSFDIKDAKDVLESKLEIGAEDTPYNRHYGPLMDEPIRKAIFEKKIAPKGKPPNFLSMADGIAKVRQGMYGFFMEVSSGYQVMQDTYYEHEKCNLIEIDYVPMVGTDPTLAVPGGSQFQEIWNVNFLRMIEAGLRNRHYTRLYVKKPVCASSLSFQSVGIIDAYPALLVIPWGLLFSLIIFFLEKFIASKRMDSLFCTKI